MIRSVLTAAGVMVILTWAGLADAIVREGIAEEGAPGESIRKQDDGPATHNMLIVGEKTVYLSHLPMFQEPRRPPMPHRYQAILEVTLAGRGGDPQLEYAKDRQAHRATKVYTLGPEPFVLPTLVSKDARAKAPLRQLKATVFRGHLEKPRGDDKAILNDIDVHVERVVHFREFDPNAVKPAGLEYLLFGKGPDVFLAHLITKPPDFDQVLKVEISDHGLTDEELAAGVRVAFPGTANDVASRLKEAQQAAGEIRIGDLPSPRTIQVKVSSELYFEEGELRVPPEFRQTREEARAGMP